MKSRDFCYWLQGYFEISFADENKKSQATALSFEQTLKIQNHLNMVFKHEIDPSFGDEKKQRELSKAHHGMVGDNRAFLVDPSANINC